MLLAVCVALAGAFAAGMAVEASPPVQRAEMLLVPLHDAHQMSVDRAAIVEELGKVIARLEEHGAQPALAPELALEVSDAAGTGS